jgi:two-component system, NarL family, nitrate/nitrite sensor histidine kinase NarX
MSSQAHNQNRKIPLPDKRMISCVSTLFMVLIALGGSSFWVIHTEDNQTLAITIHFIFLIGAFFLVAYTASKNQKLRNEQTTQKSLAQNILYDITTNINACRDLKELLNIFCHSIHKDLQAKNVSIWLITEHNWLEYITSEGIDAKVFSETKRIRLTQELAKTLVDNKIIHSNEHVMQLAEILLCDISGENKAYYIPLHYQKRTVGLIRIKITNNPFENIKDLEELLITLGKHLTIAIEKARADQEAKRMLIMQERNLIANELHDSLAQTLASLRFQVRVLDETLQPMSEFKSIRGIEQVENSLDEAYSDLRELIAHCRTPINKQGLIPAVEKLASRLRKESGTHVLLQEEWQYSDLPPNLEMHIFRIIQEAINNIRKHSQANNVRIMFRCDEEGHHHVLIENDGIGFETPKSSDHPGKHLGLTIMQERAAHLNAELRIESEIDEGTRVELEFTYNNESDDDPLQRLSGISE